MKAISAILDERLKRAEIVHDKVMAAREAIRANLSPDSAEWLRGVFNELQAIHHILGGDPFQMHMEAAFAETESAIERAYGILWRDNSRTSPEKSIAARKELFAVMSKDQQKRGIEYALALYGPTTDAEILSADFEVPLTEVQRSVRDGTFSVRSTTDEERAAIGKGR